MDAHLKFLVVALLTTYAAASMLAATPTPSPLGFVEGKLTFAPQRGVDLADDVPAAESSPSVGEQALVIRSKAGAAQVKEIRTDEKGQYRVALPPGEYVLELKNNHARDAHPRSLGMQRTFTVIASETLRVDLQVPADIRHMH